LISELQNFKATISAAGHDSYGAGQDWRENNHDNLVPARPPGPPLDLTRLNPPERGELEGLAAPVTRAGGRPDFADLDDDDLFRLGTLVLRVESR